MREKTSGTAVSQESMVAVNRYAGAALCSMINNRLKISCDHNELQFLYLMTTHCSLSSSNCFFVEVSSDMLPFFKFLSKIVSLTGINTGGKPGISPLTRFPPQEIYMYMYTL